jgi:hypothetical protein
MANLIALYEAWNKSGRSDTVTLCLHFDTTHLDFA